jgi:hypothetical protein
VDPGESEYDERERAHARALRPPELAGFEPIHEGRGSLERAASASGNRGFARLIARMHAGEGILAGGLVHPDVEAAIAASAGGGRPLAGSLTQRLERSFGTPLGDVRVHADEHAAALSRAVSARAFTVGSDIFFGEGEYRPASRDGTELITHEVAHVVQQRGMPSDGPLIVSQPGDSTEREAEALARDLAN